MRIQHNIMAMNAYRNYTNNTSAVAKNLEKLSSGYRINRAGDDAAGLAISEKMRAQITGLSAAQKNVKDGISLVKTAEGATQEIHDMLNRMVYLAEQSANGTYQDKVDREAIEDEFNALKTEINRIADSSNFNGIKLLDGSMDGAIQSINEADLIKDADIVADGQLGKDGQAGVFSIDFTNASVAGKSGAATKFKIFNQSLTLLASASAKGKTLEGSDLAKTIADKWTALAANNKKFGGVEMKAEAQGDKVIFTMQGAPTTDVTTAGTGVFSGHLSSSQGEQVVVTPDKEPISAGANRQYGQAAITLTADMVKDGKTLKIGDTTYVIAQGKNSKYKDAENVIDLTDIEAATLAAKITDGTVGQRIANAAADNKNFKVGSYIAGADAAKLTFTEKEGGVDYSKNNLAGEDGKGTGVVANATANKDADADDWKGLIMSGDVNTAAKGSALTLQIGDTSDSFNQLKVSIKDMHTDALGLDGLTLGTQTGAQDAVATIKDAINSVSSTRGKLGATQNRLEHTQNNLSVMKENIQDAESSIRDTDIAEEMMAYTKNNILVQSAQAMLAQANQVPQGVLQLLG